MHKITAFLISLFSFIFIPISSMAEVESKPIISHALPVPTFARAGECGHNFDVRLPNIYQNIKHFAIFIEYQTYEHKLSEFPEYIQPAYIRSNIKNVLRQKFDDCVDFNNSKTIVYPENISDPIFESPDTYAISFHIMYTSDMSKTDDWYIRKIEYRNGYTDFKNLWNYPKSTSSVHVNKGLNTEKLKEVVNEFTTNVGY